MNLFRRFDRRQSARAVVIGLDGTPHSLLTRLIEEGRMPVFGRLLKRGSLVPMQSVLPTVSSVAWSSIVTGCNPGKHNIFGFVDRVPMTHEMFIPGSRNMLAKTWVDLFSESGKRVFSMGVPGTYPPKPVNGVVVSGFLAPNLRKATYPPQVASELEQLGYIIDIDAWQAREDTDGFLDEVFQALDRRFEAILRFYARERWDLFVAHVMDTDRLHHFLWGQMEEGSEAYEPWFYRFYQRVDSAIGDLLDLVDEDVLLIILSDHGFCRLKKEVHLNVWLKEAGLLALTGPEPKQLLDLAPETRCYSLLPGRIYVRLRGRERGGCVDPGADYEALRRHVASGLEGIVDPETGERVIDRVYTREELYKGDAFEFAPDLVAQPARGYDLKGGFEKDVLLGKGPVTGTHTLDDAMLYVNRPGMVDQDACLVDVLPTVFHTLGLPVPDGVDGRVLEGLGR